MKYVFNTPIITAYGTFRYRKIDVETAVEFLRARDWQSAVGHEGTASLLNQLSGVEIPVRRERTQMRAGDTALVFRILQRLPENTGVLDREALRGIPHEYGLLEMIKEDQP